MSKSKKNKKDKAKTIGAMCGSRGTWGALNPVSRVVPDKKNKYKRQPKHKNRGDY